MASTGSKSGPSRRHSSSEQGGLLRLRRSPMSMCTCAQFRPMTDLAYLSFRLSKDDRDRLKAVAQERRESVQALMRQLVGGLLADHERSAPDLADVLRRLRAHAPDLHRRGVEHLWVFGS